MRVTAKSRILLDLIRQGEGEAGIYRLARAAGRPYRRVHDQVYRLQAAGLVRVEGSRSGGRAAARVLPVLDSRPRLALRRDWSAPSGTPSAEAVIAQVLARPTFHDLLACVRHYGMEPVERIFETMSGELELAPGAAEADRRMLSNIELGRARAAETH